MSKYKGNTPQVIIRVSVETKKMIKEFGGSYAQVWRLGLERFLEIMPGKLQEKAKYHEKMLLQCNNKLAKCNNIVITKKNQLDEICLQYIASNRSIPGDKFDRSWIEAKIKLRGLSTDVDGFLNRCRELKELGG
jgi:hypothetical protein